jgi:hypothetical protein
VDEFLYNKIRNKLTYWTTVHLSLAGGVLIVNTVLLSSLWYFIMIWDGSITIIWAGSITIIRQICGILWDFMWYG